MPTKERYERTTRILLAVVAVVSMAAWAFEETTILVPEWGRYAEYACAAALAADAFILGIGLTLLAVRTGRDSSLPSPFVELASSAPVIVLSSAPALYALLEGNEDFLPAFLLTARSLRILRLYRVLPGSSAAVLATLTACEILRSLAGSVLPDSARYSASLRLLLVPETLLVLGAALLKATGPLFGKSGRRTGSAGRESVVGEDELAGLLGKKGSW